MEIGGNVSRNKGQTNKKMSLEDYQTFVQSRSYNNLNVKQLNQILTMHGYRKKPAQFNKKTLIEAVQTLDLVETSRSTLDHSISPLVSTLDLDEITADLAQLNWLDDPVVSVESVNLGKPSYSTLQGPKAAGQAAAKRRQGKKKTSAASVGGSDLCKKRVRIDHILPDEYSWKSAGKMPVDGCIYKRNYYKCTVSDCPARKHVDGPLDDPEKLTVEYIGEHSHAPENMSAGVEST